MRAYEFLSEGGWDSTVTQGTVITPSVVKKSLQGMEKLISGFNSWSAKKGLPPIRIGAPLGSSAYHEVDDEEKIYGDVDLQVVVPVTDDTKDMSGNQLQSYWNKLIDDYIQSHNLSFIHPESPVGHPIVQIGDDKWVQVDSIIHPENLERWGKARTTPERGIKGLLMGGIFSSLSDALGISIQQSGVQMRVRDGGRVPFSQRKGTETVTISTDPETWIIDLFRHYYQKITGQGPEHAKIDPRLERYTGVDMKDAKINHMVQGLKGLAKSFALNGMYGKGDLSDFSSPEELISEVWKSYEEKALKDINNPKRDKAETPEAKARAESDREKVRTGLEYVRKMFWG